MVEDSRPASEHLEINPEYRPTSSVNVSANASEAVGPVDGIALCLSGGGYRAMLFHLGALWRLNELGYLQSFARVSSVSGGSITAGVLALAWGKLAFDASGVSQRFQQEAAAPLRRMASTTIDWKVMLSALFSFKSVGEKLAKSYDKHLFHGATLQELPDESATRAPRFVINASNVQSGAIWRFMRPYMRDYRVGEVKNPKLPLAIAVAASSAFPPVLSPLVLKLGASQYTVGSGKDLQREPFTTRPVLTDGGVYDNLGLETAWKRYRTILVSDAGGKMGPEGRPKLDWVRHTVRVLELIDNQVRSLRRRQVIDALQLGHAGGPDGRDGAYWGIRTNILNYGLSDPLKCPHDLTMRLAGVSTRLATLDSVVQERLINWGYAVCDAAIRKHVLPTASRPPDFPYPASGVG